MVGIGLTGEAKMYATEFTPERGGATIRQEAISAAFTAGYDCYERGGNQYAPRVKYAHDAELLQAFDDGYESHPDNLYGNV
jgi:hypothetical protein